MSYSLFFLCTVLKLHHEDVMCVCVSICVLDLSNYSVDSS